MKLHVAGLSASDAAASRFTEALYVSFVDMDVSSDEPLSCFRGVKLNSLWEALVPT